MFNRFEYLLNAVYYFLYCGRVRSIKRDGKIISLIVQRALKMPFVNRWSNQLWQRIEQNTKSSEGILYNKENSVSIVIAKRLFDCFYTGYHSLVSSVLTGTAIRVLHTFDLPIGVMTVGIPICISYIPAYKAVFSDDRYLQYFKQFEKEDEAWHKKWKRRTIAFCVGSVITTLLGMAAAFAIAIL